MICEVGDGVLIPYRKLLTSLPLNTTPPRLCHSSCCILPIVQAAWSNSRGGFRWPGRAGCFRLASRCRRRRPRTPQPKTAPRRRARAATPAVHRSRPRRLASVQLTPKPKHSARGAYVGGGTPRGCLVARQAEESQPPTSTRQRNLRVFPRFRLGAYPPTLPP